MNNYYEAIDSGDKEAAIKLFLSRDVLQNKEEEYIEKAVAARKMVDLLKETSCEYLMAILREGTFPKQDIISKNIPQFSDIYCMDTILGIVKANPDGKYDTFGYFFAKEAGYEANRKFGENHYKLASQSGLTTCKEPFRLTALGEVYCVMNKKDRDMVRAKLFMQIPIIQKLLLESETHTIKLKGTLMEYLSEKTAERRRSSAKALLKQICAELEHGEEMLKNMENK